MQEYKSVRRLTIKKSIILIALSFCLISILLTTLAIDSFRHPFWNSEKIVLIEKGSSLSQITSRLVENEVLGFPFLFKIRLLCTGEWRDLRAGEYLIPAEVTPNQLIKILKSGQVVLHPVTVIEGETSYHLTQKLLKDARFQGPCTVPPEGSLLPETYHFARGTERQSIINHLQKAMDRAIANLWLGRPKDCLFTTPKEALILASIVEKETSLPHERSIVAAVFLNRIKENMLLQADPTIHYALTKGREPLNRSLTLEDLKVDSPYNTYLYRGLPPTPIANPGLLSLKAVMYPMNISYFYFVADGSGGHVFATTLEEHQKNHAAWRKMRDDNREREKRSLSNVDGS